MNTSSQQAAASVFNALLTQIRDAATGLFAILEREHALLKLAKNDGLTELADEKLQQLAMLNELDKRRVAQLQQWGFGSSTEEMTTCLNKLGPPDNEIIQLWSAIQQLLEKCQKQNLVNGGAIELGRNRVQQSLALLRGEDATEGLYDTKGRNDGGTGGRSLARA